MIVHEAITQGSDEWHAIRAGIPTASEFSRIITPGGKPSKSTTSEGWIDELIAARVIGSPPPNAGAFQTRAMEFGTNMEPEARRFYAYQRTVKVDVVGFITTDDGRAGGSPDGLVGLEGGLEVKCPLVKTHVGWLRAGGMPKEHRPQVHGYLVISGRPWWDFLSYCQGLPPILERVYRDDFTVALEKSLGLFLLDYDAAWTQIEAKLIPAAESFGAKDTPDPSFMA